MIRTLLVLAVIVAVVFVGLAFGSRLDHGEAVHAGAPSTATTVLSDNAVPSLGDRFGELVVAMRPQPKARTAPHADVGVWDRIAGCESGGRWDDTRAGYEGGLHFAHDTWVRAGGRRYAEHAYQATREQQIEIAVSWLARTSWEQWPVCSRKVGAR